MARNISTASTPLAALNRSPPRRVEPRFFVKAIITTLALVALAFVFAVANPKLGMKLGIFGGDESSSRMEDIIGAGFGAAVSSLLLLYQFMLYQREKYLMSHGAAAPATYTGYYEYLRQGERFARVTYAFTDNRGQLIQGEKSGIQAPNDLRPEWAKLADLNGGKPVVFFDTADSTKHMIYPGALAEFV